MKHLFTIVFLVALSKTWGDLCAKKECGPHQKCVISRYGTARCICVKGYVLALDEVTCIKDDPCLFKKCGPNQSCVRARYGTARCICSKGFILDLDEVTCIKAKDDLMSIKAKDELTELPDADEEFELTEKDFEELKENLEDEKGIEVYNEEKKDENDETSENKITEKDVESFKEEKKDEEDETFEKEKRGCSDNNGQCPGWAGRGECRRNPNWMLRNCKKSCGVCNGGGSSSCKDRFTNCNEHAAKGYCTKQFVDWMKKNCCGTCKKLGAGGGAAAKKPKTGSKGSGKSKKDGCLASANAYRNKHRNTNNLQWDPVLASKAQAYAEKLLNDGLRNGGNVWQIMKHDPENKVGEGMGENLYYQDNWNTGDDTFYCQKADESWYDEKKDYSFSSGRGNGGVVTHFTQMVWRNSKKVGYGVAVTDSPRFKGNKLAVVVAKYTPKGNWGNDAEFRKNVGYPK